jgi:hypothetical protein
MKRHDAQLINGLESHPIHTACGKQSPSCLNSEPILLSRLRQKKKVANSKKSRNLREKK